MKTEEFVYKNICDNCGVSYDFKYKDDSVIFSRCPLCNHEKQVPREILKIEKRNIEDNEKQIFNNSIQK